MRKIIAIGAASAALIAAPAFAGTSSTQMPVTATVIDACTVAASPMAFGTLPVLGASNIDTTATVSLACTIGTSYSVGMDFGTHAAGGTQRFLQSSTDATQTIPYEVYLDSARTQVWNSSAGNVAIGVATSGTGSHTAYGRIPTSAGSVKAGSYSDSVTVTVTF
ncbi:spore coat U domain-containing protein [Croceicoccus sp. BE223]|uniref:Csu type fimbrial protein n=1 Tax=Croceicoccus sp. BE223 TaxID=2817716 RepID=UPI0028598565|nr:spore coat U domain-containing protein [Croceicoccus sp. BE223]MDR7101349.1 spore coat protein U-like protein [Croceicoccus sp. BE223]